MQPTKQETKPTTSKKGTNVKNVILPIGSSNTL